MSPKLTAFRRTALIGAVWVVAMAALVVLSPSASGQEDVEPGRGSAYAQGYRIDPRSGRLSFGITYGMALAGHQNTVAVGEARSVDLGVIGTTLAGEACDGGDPTLPEEDQPQPVVVRSTDENSESGTSENEYGVQKTAIASDRPLAEAEAVTAALGDAAAVQIGSTVSRTSSGIVDGVRIARAITEVSKISIAEDALVLRGLRWEAMWQSAPEEKTSGSFTVEAVEAAGAPIAENLSSLAELNPILEPLGIRIDAPQVRQSSGISFVDPLRISVVPSEERDGVVSRILGNENVVDLRQDLVDLLVDIDCGNASYITILDIVLGSITGAGSLNIEIGGVTAQSADLVQSSFLGGLPSFTPSAPATTPPSAPSPPSTAAPTVTSGTAETTGSGEGTSVVTEPASSTGAESANGPLFDTIAGKAGGPLVWVGLGGLLLLGALAELDRRKMRRAQRTVLLQAPSS